MIKGSSIAALFSWKDFIMKNKVLILSIIPLLISMPSCSSSGGTKNFVAGKDLTLTSIEMCDHYGDATLIQYEDYDILIDSGAPADARHVNEVLNSKVQDKKIDLLIVTHPHGDHIGGIINGALSGFDVASIVDYGYQYVTSDNGTIENSSYVANYTNWRDNLISAGTAYLAIQDALKQKTWIINKEEDCYIKWLKNDYYIAKNDTFPSNKYDFDNPNTASVSCYLSYKYWNIVLCGDIDSSLAEMSITINHDKLFKEKDRVMLKATHHGSSSSMGSAFLDWCNPELIYVSAALVDGVAIPNQVELGSGDDKQNHPNKSTVRRMVNYTDNIYWNAINGDLTIVVDGVNDAVISGAGRHKNYYRIDANEASIEQEKNCKFVDSEFYKYYTKK